MWVYWYPPISNLLQGHDIDPSNSSACSKQPGVRNRTSLHSMGQPSNTYWVDVETCMLKHAETCWNMLKLWISASICTGLSHLEDLAPKKKKRTLQTLQVKFSSAPENPWNGFQPSSLPHGDLHLIWWGHWPSNRDLHEHEPRGPILLGTSSNPSTEEKLEPELEANLKHRKKYRTSLWHVQNLKFIEFLIEPKGCLNSFKLDSLQVYTGFKVPSNFLAFTWAMTISPPLQGMLNHPDSEIQGFHGLYHYVFLGL